MNVMKVELEEARGRLLDALADIKAAKKEVTLVGQHWLGQAEKATREARIFLDRALRELA